MASLKDIESQISLIEMQLGEQLQVLEGTRRVHIENPSMITPRVTRENINKDSGISTIRKESERLSARRDRASGRSNAIFRTRMPTASTPVTTSGQARDFTISLPKDKEQSMPRLAPYTGECEEVKAPVVREKDKSSHRSIKVANYDGTSEWRDYKSHFDACAVINGWSMEEKGLYLAAALRGQAQCVLGDLPTEKQCRYDSLKSALEERFAPPNQTDLYRVQLKERRQRATESLPELGQAIRRLVNKAYPGAPAEVRETLSMESFLDALVNPEMRIKIKQSKPCNLNQAICLAVELEATYNAENKSDYNRGHVRGVTGLEEESALKQEDQITEMMKTFNEKLDMLQKEINEVKSERFRGNFNKGGGFKRDKTCYECGKKGHFRFECKEIDKDRKDTAGGNQSSARSLRGRRKQRRNRVHISSNATNRNAGVYVDLLVNGAKAKFLIDTGTTLCLVSNQGTKRPRLNPLRQTVLSANGTDLASIGQSFFDIKIGDVKTEVEAVVADLPMDGILGLISCKVKIVYWTAEGTK